MSTATLTPTPCIGDSVRVPACAINPGGIGIIQQITTLWAAGERECMVVYTVEVAGDWLWFALHEMEVVG